MKILEKDTNLFFLIVMFTLAGSYLIWQFIGLRLTTHDDILYHLISRTHSNNYFDIAKSAAIGQARLQHVVTLSAILAIYKLSDSIIIESLSLYIAKIADSVTTC